MRPISSTPRSETSIAQATVPETAQTNSIAADVYAFYSLVLSTLSTQELIQAVDPASKSLSLYSRLLGTGPASIGGLIESGKEGLVELQGRNF